MSVSKIKEKATISYIGTETFEYTLNRAKRLFPEFFCGFILAFVLMEIIRKDSILIILEKLMQTGIYELMMLQIINPYENMVLSIAWYISALLFATFIIYPFLRLMPDIYKNIISPLIIACYIVFASTGDDFLVGNMTIYCFVKGGMLRAIAEISWGTFLFERVKFLRKNKLTNSKLKQFMWSLIECTCFVFVIIGAFKYGNTKWDFTFFIVLSIGITICLSEIGLSVASFSNNILNFCSNYSYALYMSHRRIVDFIKMLFPSDIYPVRFAYYMLFSICISLIVYKVCELWRKHSRN